MKNTIKNIAASDLPSSARGLFVSVFAVGLLGIAGCSALPSPPSRPLPSPAPQQLPPYSQARWSQPPAQLLQQRLREQLGQRRAILKADDGAAQARDAAQGGR